MSEDPGAPGYLLASPGDTMEAGGILALALEAEGRLAGPLTITLEGPLGSGKTTFAKGFGAALGVPPGEITSPTFALAFVHSGRVPFAHLDLYRLGEKGDPLDEFREAGLDEFLGGLSLVEWPERLGGALCRGGALRVILREAPALAPAAPGGEAAPRLASFLGCPPQGLGAALAAFPRLQPSRQGAKGG
jgi:tRNA threonylcarbamoyl adenosine modification protein YjeE